MGMILGNRGVAILPARLWAATVLVIASGLAVMYGLPVQPSSAQSTYSPAPDSTHNKSSEFGVWHHFGDSRPMTPSPAARQSTGWRRFGDGGNPPPSLPPLPTQRSLQATHAAEMERFMVELINRDRANPANEAETNGRAQPLRWNDRLAAVARAHSLDMLNQGYFAHTDGQGRSVAQRVEAAGMAWQTVGENIAIYDSVAGAEAAFMYEPRFAKNHRANILNTSFAEVGVGIVEAPNGTVYVTQDFYTSPSPAAHR